MILVLKEVYINHSANIKYLCDRHEGMCPSVEYSQIVLYSNKCTAELNHGASKMSIQ